MSEMNTKTNAESAPVADDTVYLTPPAVAEVKRLMADQDGGDDLMLRLSVQGGGCSGLSYDMNFDRIHGEFDSIFEFDGLKVVVDAKSLLYIGGTTIDFTKELLTGGFKFNNPKSARSCGCGTSFSV